MNNRLQTCITYFVIWFSSVAVMMMVYVTNTLILIPVFFIIPILHHHEESLLPYLTTKIDVDVILFLLVVAGILTSAVICNLPGIHEFLF